jgi:hypothetical protein
MKTRRRLVYALALGPTVAAHAEFSWELAGSTRRAERGEFLETDGSALAATYFFDPVGEDRGPYALAAFFDPATRMTAAFREEKQTTRAAVQSGQSIEAQRDLSDWSIDGQYLLPESQWYFGGRYGRGDIDLPSTTSITEDGTGYGALAGKYFGSATKLELALERSTVDSEVTTQFCLFGICSIPRTTTLESTADTARISVMHARQGRALAYAVFGDVAETRLEVRVAAAPPPQGVVPGPPAGGFVVASAAAGLFAAATELEPRRSYSIGTELFPTRKLGLRIGYTAFDGELEDNAQGVGATWFFRPKIGIGVDLVRQEYHYGAPSSDSAALRVIGRL